MSDDEKCVKATANAVVVAELRAQADRIEARGAEVGGSYAEATRATAAELRAEAAKREGQA